MRCALTTVAYPSEFYTSRNQVNNSPIVRLHLDRDIARGSYTNISFCSDCSCPTSSPQWANFCHRLQCRSASISCSQARGRHLCQLIAEDTYRNFPETLIGYSIL